MKKNRYQNLEETVAIDFNDKAILDVAFVHKSYVNEKSDDKNTHNERLEFLGDAVLELVVTEYLYKTYPEKGEGILTNWRSALVQGKHLAEIAEQLELGKYLYLSRGEEKSGGRRKSYILANTLEAFIGAIYIDQGYKTAHKFIDTHIVAKLSGILDKGLHIDAKSRLQEIAQEVEMVTPEYKLIKEDGPDHDKVFTMGAFLNDQLVAEGAGSSKQKAEQDAAENALKAKKWESITLEHHL
ncbi:ribonuclease III [Candidatus Peregrinibacteria bacterium]|nr:ribonuclease III [Candidatus Peregrinibacteria bacterium]